MLRMIIADDEKLVREGLTDLLDWPSYGIEIIAFAKNGAEALTLCEDLNPDILFTDIRMPQMSGIEVIERLRLDGFKTRSIILSGYDDFTHAQDAITLKVEDYILKPIKADNVKQIITKVVKSIKDEREKALHLSTLNQQMSDNLPIIRARFLINTLFRAYNNHDELQRKITFLHIPFEIKGDYIVCKLIIDDIIGAFSEDVEENYQLILMSITNVIHELIEKHPQVESINITDSEFVLILNTDNRDFVKDVCSEIQEAINHYLNITISIGIGTLVKEIQNINESYISAESALDYKFFTGTNSIIDINDVQENDQNQCKPFVNHQFDKPIITNIKTGNTEHVIKLINELFSSLNITSCQNVDYTKSIIIELVAFTSRSLYEINEDLDNILVNKGNLINRINNITSLDDVQKYIVSIYTQLSDYFYHKLNQKNAYAINQLTSLIKSQYSSTITVQNLAEQVNLTPNYISQIFKKSMDTTITKYITQTRIEAAKELLEKSDFKVYEVAEMVGFDNPYYFSTVFKKIVGVHPSKFNRL